MTNYKQIPELNIFAAVLVVQSLPFIAAVAIAALEGSRFNEFAYWRGVEAKVAETLPRPGGRRSAGPGAAERSPADKPRRSRAVGSSSSGSTPADRRDRRPARQWPF